MTIWRGKPTLRKPLEQLTQFDRIDPTVPIFADRGGIQRYPFEYHSLIIRRQTARNDMRSRPNAHDRRVRDVHLVAVRRVYLDPDIVASVPARADPHGHRQPLGA